MQIISSKYPLAPLSEKAAWAKAALWCDRKCRSIKGAPKKVKAFSSLDQGRSPDA